MINIVIPMAGRGKRFSDAGYILPKPLIDIKGHHMIEYVIQNVRPICEYRFIFLCLEEHLEKYNLSRLLKEIEPTCEIVAVDKVTEGAACTVLLAEDFIDNSDSLMIANSDQYVDIDINDYIKALGGNDGLIMTMTADDPKWSFVSCDADGYINCVREKEVISNEATVGIYNYKHGSDFVKYAKQMIKKDIRVNNEFYVAPVYNQMIADGEKIVYYNIGSEGQGMYGLGIPEDLNRFLANPISEGVFND